MTRNDAIVHEEARLLAAEAVDLELAPDEAAWLDEHLAACPDCAAIAAEYQSNHLELSALAMPEPPRDLWARTQAALDQVDGHRGPARRAPGSMSKGSLFGSSLAVLVVVLLAGASLLSQTPIARPAGSSGNTAAPIAVATTFSGATTGTGSTSPVAVVNGTSYWISGGNGLYSIMGGTSTCDPADSTCTVTSGGGKTLGTIASQTSVSAAIAPDANVAAVWTADKIAILPLTDASKTVSLDQMTPQPTLVVTPRPTTPATSTPSATPTAAPASPTATAAQTAIATATSGASAMATPTAAASNTPAPTIAPSATASASVQITAKPGTGGPIAILSGYEIVGRDPEFAPDGRTVAFSARPSNHDTGPDVFIWQVGDMQAHPITTSHSDQFAGWFGKKLLISEIASGKGSASSSEAVGATSYVFDVASGTKLRISRPMLMPSVDPSGTYVVYWTGRVQFDPVLGIWQPDGGDLYFDRWANLTLVSGNAPAATSTPTAPVATPTPTLAASATPASSASPADASPSATPTEAATPTPNEHASATPAPTPTPTLAPTPVPTAAAPSLPQRLPVAQGSGVVRTWQIRWDTPGHHIAAWVADKGSAKVGRLSLFSVNEDRNLVDIDEPLLNAERVMSTIQFDSSHLVWTSAVDGKTYLQEVPVLPPSSIATSSQAPGTAPQTTDRPGA